MFATQVYDVTWNGQTFKPGLGNSWKINEAGMMRVKLAERLVVGRNQIRFKRFGSDFAYSAITNNWDDTGGPSELLYVVQSANRVIERCILMTTDSGDICLASIIFPGWRQLFFPDASAGCY